MRPGGVMDNGFMKMWCEKLGESCGEDLIKMSTDVRTDPFYLSKVPELGKINIPALVCMSYSDQGLHTNGSFRVFREISSKEKWLYTHRDGKWAAFYDPKCVALQLQFLDYFLKEKTDNGMNKVPRVSVEIRDAGNHVHQVLQYEEAIYPTPDTKWTSLYLGKDNLRLEPGTMSEIVHLDALEGNVEFSHTFTEDTTTTGPMKLTLILSSDNLTDMNLFVYVKKLNIDGREVYFEGMFGYGMDVVTKGWQRLAVRKPFEKYTEEWDCDKPFDTLEPFPIGGKKETVTVALLPSATFFEKGSTISLFIQGRWMHPVGPLSTIQDYLPSTLPGTLKIHCGGEDGSSLLLGLI